MAVLITDGASYFSGLEHKLASVLSGFIQFIALFNFSVALSAL
jgi:hypothetical protein